MKLHFLGLLALPLAAAAQQTPPAQPAAVAAADTTVYTNVDQPAEFPGGRQGLNLFLGNNLKYPEGAMRTGGGKVITRFIVEANGKLSNLHISQPARGDLNAEALRVVRAMPRWKPARLGGRAVRSWASLPLIFGPVVREELNDF